MGELVSGLLGSTLAGVKVKIWLGLLAVLAAGAFIVIAIADNAVEDTLEAAKDAGAAEATVQGHETTLDQLERANEAEDDIRFDRDNARYTACLRDVAPGYEASCERYRQQD